jgi:UDP-N-acetylmuramoyl-tripeptide--D-alanyl-D-alanine ligase
VTPRTLAELAGLLGGRVIGDPAITPTGVAIDSRGVRPGDLFVALPGERTDGHDFVDAALAGGAVAALVARPVATSLAQLVVGDPLSALQRLAATERAAAPYRLAAVTGSIGKTTTKEFLAALLGSVFPVGATKGSRNSQAGFPAELANQPGGIAWFVAELGMSHAGELDRLGAIASPDALLYTVIAPVHLKFFASVERIADAKAELIPHLRRDGLLVLNNADSKVAALAHRFAGQTVTYGVPHASDLWLAEYEGRGLLGASFRLSGPLGEASVTWSLAGRHQATNFLAAAALALTVGVPAHAVAPVAAGLRPAHRRGEVHSLADGTRLIDDSYNSSPDAAKSLLALLAQTPGRHVAVLGEMLELGETSPALHREVGEVAGRSADVVVAVGGQTAAELARAAGPGARHAPTTEQAMALVTQLLRPGDVVLVKGSRGIGLDRLVDALREERR